MVIDTHQHFWRYQPKKHSWINDRMKIIRRDFLPQDLIKIFNENKINYCVAVQADQSTSETNFLVELSETHSFIKGVVGWVDLKSEELESYLNTYKNKDIIKGFRHVVQDESDHNFMLRPQFLNGIKLLGKYDYCYDILVFPHQLGSVLELTKKFPNQKFVLDHIGKPYILDNFFYGWATLIREIGKLENVYCKFSGMITEADHKNWKKENIHPYMDLVMESFGSERVMFGSDWPVCLVAGDYSEVKKLVTDFISTFSPNEKNLIMYENAINFYNLKI